MAVKTSFPQVWHSAKPTLTAFHSLFLFGPLSVETIYLPKDALRPLGCKLADGVP